MLWLILAIGVIGGFGALKCCCGITCLPCTDGTAPETVELVLSGFTGTCGGGGSCSAMDGTYELTATVNITGYCRYSLDPGLDCVNGDFTGWFEGATPNQWFEVNWDEPNSKAPWYYYDTGNFSTPFDCAMGGPHTMTQYTFHTEDCNHGTVTVEFIA